MGRVRLLPEILAHKIAAGEIVERPASVVKELLENALDAEATSVSVKADVGGQHLISIRDDGIGMSPEDARLAFQHHATSKLQTFEDLSCIQTLGFRGEALPSIASISRLRLRTVEAPGKGTTNAPGTEVQYEGGELRDVRPIAWPRGTEVEVRDLFFNVPARRKFLKTTSTELSHITRQITHYALAHPEVKFVFQHGGRTLLEAAAVETLKERVFQVLGDAFLSHLVPVDYQKEGVQVRGLASLPHEQRSNASSQFLFVNRRMVRDRVITHAIHLAYRDLIPSRTYPVILLFLEIDPQQIDVNVHPAKTEIRFKDTHSVHTAVYHGIEEALLKSSLNLRSVARDIPATFIKSAEPGRAADTSLSETANPFFSAPMDAGGHAFSPRNLGGQFLSSPRLSREIQSNDPHLQNIPETYHLSPTPVVLGQFVESFIVAADREGVLLIDQHVAHERILYDRALRSFEEGQTWPVQRLLEPVTLELTAQQKSVMDDLLDELNANGFLVDWFGESTAVIRGVPAIASNCDGRKVLQEILDRFQDADSPLLPGENSVRRRREKIAISLSCRAAIKINTSLTREKIQWLLDELFACENPYTCPHGRPIILRVNIEDVLRGFKRI